MVNVCSPGVIVQFTGAEHVGVVMEEVHWWVVTFQFVLDH